MRRFDTIVVGSGFGGAVMACRLQEKGARVLVLERGRRWEPADYPASSQRHWLWDEADPERANGWLDFRYFGDMSVVQGAGVGGGSLLYANVSVEAPPRTFRQGWPEPIDAAALEGPYARVGRMLGVQRLPENQWTRRTRLMRDAARALGEERRFRLLPQAVNFDPGWHYQLDDPFAHHHSRRFVNEHGRRQGTCVHCGNCDLGCPVGAKNTLDLNYLARAEALGTEIRPLHQVRVIQPEAVGYQVQVRDLAAGRTEVVTAPRLILAAGSVGSTELLLRCRDQFRTLPGLGPRLGRGWTCNGDFVTLARYGNRELSPTRGPTVSAAIDFLDQSVAAGAFLVEDGGLPDLLGNLLDHLGRHPRLAGTRLGAALVRYAAECDPASHLMPWFGQARDEAGGRFRLGRRGLMPWRRDRLRLDWDYRKAEPAVRALAAMHARLSEATGGKPWVPPSWRLLRNLVTPHPLGGCNMGDSVRDGVVDHRGEVFGYPNLFVMDGSVVPAALGINPSRTIAALAERAADLIA